MDTAANTRAALASLALAAEDQRAFGEAIEENGRMCACAWLARPLDVNLHPGIDTGELIDLIAARTDIPRAVLCAVPWWNDERNDACVPLRTFRQIAMRIKIALPPAAL
jgi:hypothetical protein